MTVHRTFIAVELTGELRDRVLALQRDMEHAGANLRWTSLRNLHFTLRFLGEISGVQVARAIMAARHVGSTSDAFSVSVGGLGAFPSLARPRVVWVGATEGGPALEELAAMLNGALARERFEDDPRRFRPHLTVGRVYDDSRWGDVVRSVERFRDVRIGAQQVGAMVVMESRLTARGAVYTPLEEVPLGQRLHS